MNKNKELYDLMTDIFCEKIILLEEIIKELKTEIEILKGKIKND